MFKTRDVGIYLLVAALVLVGCGLVTTPAQARGAGGGPSVGGMRGGMGGGFGGPSMGRGVAGPPLGRGLSGRSLGSGSAGFSSGSGVTPGLGGWSPSLRSGGSWPPGAYSGFHSWAGANSWSNRSNGPIRSLAPGGSRGPAALPRPFHRSLAAALPRPRCRLRARWGWGRALTQVRAPGRNLALPGRLGPAFGLGLVQQAQRPRVRGLARGGGSFGSLARARSAADLLAHCQQLWSAHQPDEFPPARPRGSG